MAESTYCTEVGGQKVKFKLRMKKASEISICELSL